MDALLLGLGWGGADGEAEHVDPGVFCDDPAATRDDPAVTRGVLLARSPDSVRELAAVSERIRPRLGGLRQAFQEYAATPHGWIRDFDEFTDLLGDWDRVLFEAAGQRRGVVGLSG